LNVLICGAGLGDHGAHDGEVAHAVRGAAGAAVDPQPRRQEVRPGR
jgi:hypothetical protein